MKLGASNCMTTTVLWWSGLEHLVGVLGTRSITAKRSRGFYEYFLIFPLWPCGGGVRPCGLNSLVAFGARSMSSPKVCAGAPHATDFIEPDDGLGLCGFSERHDQEVTI